MIANVLFATKVLIAFLFLAYSARCDLKERRVPNGVWAYMLLIFIPLDIVEFLLLNYGLNLLIIAIGQFLIVTMFTYFLYSMEIWGGADAKAVMALAVAFPVYPKILIFPILNTNNIFAITVLANSVIVGSFTIWKKWENGMPFILFIAIGFLISILVGDLLMTFFTNVFG